MRKGRPRGPAIPTGAIVQKANLLDFPKRWLIFREPPIQDNLEYGTILVFAIKIIFGETPKPIAFLKVARKLLNRTVL